MIRPKITLLMRAYNAEKYIRRAVESVLNQTEDDFEFFVRDNGSTDSTGKILEEYAGRDGRIVFLSNKVNWVLDEGEEEWFPIFNGEYISILDADDYLDERFFEVMYKAAKENDADLTVCGTTMLHEDSPQKTPRIPPAAAMKDLTGLGDIFVDLYGVLRTVWGKLYERDFYLEHCGFAYGSPIQSSALDTYAVLGFLQKCRSFVSINQSLHYYLIHSGSQSRPQAVSSIKIKEAELLFNRGKDCLDALGIATQKNSDALYLIHKNHVEDALNLVSESAAMSGKEKVEYFQAALEDNLYSSYALDPVFRNDTYKLLARLMKKILEDDPRLYVDRDEYLMGFYICYEEFVKNEISLLTLPRLLSVMCDKNNTKKIGIEFLYTFKSDKTDAFLKTSDKTDRKTVRRIFSHRSGDKPAERIERLLGEESFGEALDLLNPLSEEYPLDRDYLFYRIYISLACGDNYFAFDAANTAVFFWDDDEKILNITQDLKTSVTF